MTSGSRISDFPTYVMTNAGLGGSGSRSAKTWDGGDKIVSRPPREAVSRPVVFYDKFGHKKHRWGTYRPPRTKPKRAYNEVHPYSMDLLQETDGVLNWIIDYLPSPYIDNQGTGTAKNIGAGVASDAIGTGWGSNDTIAMIGKLREKVAGSDFNAGVFLGEGHEALKMIANNATKIYKALKAIRKGNFVDAQRALTGRESNKRIRFDLNGDRKALANNWLELQYGWLPLLKDVEGGAEFLYHQLSSPPVYRAVVTRKVEFPMSCVSGSPSKYTYAFGKNMSRGRILAILKETDVVALSGLMDPLSVAWELLPYSFVIDWFIPIGNYLSARGLSQSLTGTFVTTVTHKSIAGGIVGLDEVEHFYPFGVTKNSVMGDSYTYRHTIQSRTVSSTLEVPLPSVKPLSKVASWRHAANAVALLSQLKR